MTAIGRKATILISVWILLFPLVISCSYERLPPEVNIYISMGVEGQKKLKDILLLFAKENNLSVEDHGKDQPRINGEEYMWLTMKFNGYTVAGSSRKQNGKSYVVSFYNHDKKETWQKFYTLLLPILETEWHDKIEIVNYAGENE